MKKEKKDLKNLDLAVIRFTNEQIKNEVESVIEIVSSTIVELTARRKTRT